MTDTKLEFQRKMRDRREEEEEILEFKKRMLEARALVGGEACKYHQLNTPSHIPGGEEYNLKGWRKQIISSDKEGQS